MASIYTPWHTPGYNNVSSSADGIPDSLSMSRLPNCPNITVQKIQEMASGGNVFGPGTNPYFKITGGSNMGYYKPGSGYITGFIEIVNNSSTFTDRVLRASDTTYEGNTLGGTGTADGLSANVRYFLTSDRICHSVNDLRRDQQLQAGGKQVYHQLYHNVASALKTTGSPQSIDYLTTTANWSEQAGLGRQGEKLVSLTELEDFTFGEVMRLYGGDSADAGGRQGVFSVTQGQTIRVPFVMRTECPVLDNDKALPLFLMPDLTFQFWTSPDSMPFTVLRVEDGTVTTGGVGNKKLYAYEKFMMPKGCTWQLTQLVLNYERMQVGVEYEEQYKQQMLASGAVHSIPFVDFQVQNQPPPTVGGARSVTSNYQINAVTGSLNGVAIAIVNTPPDTVSRVKRDTSFTNWGISALNVQVDSMNVLQTEIGKNQARRHYIESRRMFDILNMNPFYTRYGFSSRRNWAGYSALTTIKTGERDMINKGVPVSRTVQVNVSFTGADDGGSYNPALQESKAYIAAGTESKSGKCVSTTVVEGSLWREYCDKRIPDTLPPYANLASLVANWDGSNDLYTILSRSKGLYIMATREFTVSG